MKSSAQADTGHGGQSDTSADAQPSTQQDVSHCVLLSLTSVDAGFGWQTNQHFPTSATVFAVV